MQDADGEHRGARRHLPVQEHEHGAEQQPDGARAERPDTLRQPTAGGTEDHERQGEQRDADVGDPVGRPQVTEHEHPQRVERADHQEDGDALHDRSTEHPVAQEVEGKTLAGRRHRLVDVGAGDHGDAHEREGGDSQKRGRQAERRGKDGRDRRAGGEPADVPRQQAAEVRAQVLGVGQDHDPPCRRRGHAGTEPHHEPRGEQPGERGAERHADEADDVERQAEHGQPAGVATVGHRCEQHLGGEGREEPDGDDEPELAAVQPVAGAVVVEHGEHHAVARRQQAGEERERDHDPALSHGRPRYRRTRRRR